jgi:hypothetical protein
MAAKLFRRANFVKFEVLLVIAIVALLLQVFPAAGKTVLWMLDVRNWPRTVWFWLNFVAVLSLLVMRFGPALVEDWKTRRSRLETEREGRERQRQLKEKRERLEDIRRGRNRRLP